MAQPLVLAYSGGLDTTVILHWIVAEGYDVTAVLVNLGQRTEDQEAITLWAQRVYQGYWYDPSVQYITRYFESTQEHVTGTIDVELFKGNCTVVGRSCPTTLYDQSDATGFIRLHALPLRLHANRRVES